MARSPAIHPKVASGAELEWAVTAMHSGRAAEAERISSEMLKRNPGDARAAHVYGYSLYLQGRGSEAIAPLERAAQQNRNPIVETQLGMLLREANRYDEALKYLVRAIKRQPPFPPAYLEYGSLLLEQLRYAEAIEVLTTGANLAPDFCELLVHLGAAYAVQGMGEKAASLFSRALPTAPNDPDTLFKLGFLMKNSCCFSQAANLFGRVVNRDPQDSAARLALGICLLESGQTEAAFRNLKLASEAEPKMFGLTLSAFASAGRGRFWMSRAAAERFLKNI